MSDFLPYELIQHIDAFGKGLSEWEVNFIADLVDHERFVYTDKMIEVIERIYKEKT